VNGTPSLLDQAQTPDPSAVWPQSPAPPSGVPAVEEVVTAGVLLDVTRVLGGLLGLARPALGCRTEAVTRLVRQMAEALELERPWEFEVAARLSQIGWLTVPTETHAAALRGEKLPEDDWRAVASHPLVARDLLAEVRRLDGVREMIARQHEPCAVAGELPTPFARRDRATQGGHLLHVCADYVTFRERSTAPDAALDRMATQPLEYDPALVACLRTVVLGEARSSL
jgi:hypothetical protein